MMRNKNIVFGLAYSLVVIAVMATGRGEFRPLYLVFKPLIMITLIGWAVLTPDRREVRLKQVFIVALFFSWLGDLLLMFNGLFLAGLAAFLITQILYILVFRTEIGSSPNVQGLLIRIVVLGSVLTALLLIIVPSLSEFVLRIAVPVYATVITYMTFCASRRQGSNVSTNSFWWVLAGAISFMVSDSLIAVNAFVKPIPGEHFLIMSSYMFAQFSIVWGFLKVR